MRVVQMSTVHPYHDTRIFHKICRSLAQAGHDVHLIANSSSLAPPADTGGITLHLRPWVESRWDRVRLLNRLLEQAAELHGDIYHFHDPEFLLRAHSFSSRIRKPLIYDVHEDYPAQVLSKEYLPRVLRRLTGAAVAWMESRVCRGLSAVMIANELVVPRFSWHPKCVLVQNYVREEEFVPVERESWMRSKSFVYVGGLSRQRCIGEIIRALPLAGPDVELFLGGPWVSEDFRRECASLPGWSQVRELGVVDRNQFASVLAKARAGIAFYLPTQQYLNCFPTKIFEYMASGLPVIASDFPLYRTVVGHENCGLLRNASSPPEIAGAMRWTLDHAEEAFAMGRRGREAVEARYSWKCESRKLLNVYCELGITA